MKYFGHNIWVVCHFRNLHLFFFPHKKIIFCWWLPSLPKKKFMLYIVTQNYRRKGLFCFGTVIKYLISKIYHDQSALAAY